MTTAEAAADVQVPENGEHSSPENGAGAVELTTFSFTPSGQEFGPPTGVPAARHPVDYGGPIILPKTSVIVLPGTERWFFRQLRKVQDRIESGAGSQMELPLFWLEKAGATEEVINRILLLDKDEWERFFSAWMSGAADSNLGE